MQTTVEYQKGNKRVDEAEWDRLMREREQLLMSGCYGKDDLLIREIDRQIQAA